MGCWNGTCAITQLPILEGEKVDFVFIEQRKKEIDASGVCYPESMFYIASPIMTGEYDGYGTFSNIKTAESVSKFEKIFFELIDTRLLIMEEEPHDLTKKDGIYYIVRAVERELVSCAGEFKIGVMMFKHTVLDTLMQKDCIYDKSSMPEAGLLLKRLSDKFGLSATEFMSIKQLSTIMNRLNKLIGPQCGKGGQMIHYEAFEKYIEYMREELEKLKSQKEV